MKILVFSHSFFPLIGGLATVSNILAHGFVHQGNEVILITQNIAKGPDHLPFAVIRKPGPSELFGLVRWCDVFFHNNVSLRTAWPLLFIRRPWVVAHHIWIPSERMHRLAGQLKHFVVRYAKCISISQAVADHVKTPSVVIPDPYDDQTFREISGLGRDRELIFVGRLIQDKGVHLLLEALARLITAGLRPSLTIVGYGPEREALARQARELGIREQVEFAGIKQGHDLAVLLNQHQILVVPSLWQEPFGIVALEGIACGCMVVGSEGGGLKDAIGSCGVTFPNGDVAALAQRLANLLVNPAKRVQYRTHASTHLAKHTSTAVARAYLEVIEHAYYEHSHRHQTS